MENKFKVGDLIQRTNNNEWINVGAKAVIVNIENKGFKDEKLGIEWIDGCTGAEHHNVGCEWNPKAFVLLSKTKNKRVRKQKEQPIVKHAIYKDSCNNYVSTKNSYKLAVDKINSMSIESGHTIYKLVEVAKANPTIKITKIRVTKTRKVNKK